MLPLGQRVLRRSATVGCRKDKRSGYVLPMMVIVAFVGILFGFGRLAMFQNQVKLRLDRQRAIDRTLATRSALVWLEGQQPVPSEKTNLVYQSGMGRFIDVEIFPVSPIYPDPESPEHFNYFTENQTNVAGVVFGSTALSMEPTFVDGKNNPMYDLRIGSDGSATGHYGWVQVDMENTGSWLDDMYGRRYWLEVESVAVGEKEDNADIYRFYLSPVSYGFATNTETPAIWIEQQPVSTSEADISLWIRKPGQDPESIPFDGNKNRGRNILFGKGLQLADRMLSLFEWEDVVADVSSGKYTYLLEGYELDEEFVAFFSDEDLRLTLMVESVVAADDMEDKQNNSFRWLRVDPAYDFEISLSWYDNQTQSVVSEMATVVHLRPKGLTGAFGEVLDGRAITYDTHGTAAK